MKPSFSSTKLLTRNSQLLTENKLHRATAALLHQNLFPLDEVVFQAVLVVADGEQLQAVIVLDAEIVVEASHQLIEFAFVAVEAEREHQSRGLNHIGVDVQFDANGEDGFQVVFVHKGEVAGRNADQRLVVLYYIRRYVLIVFAPCAIDNRWCVVGVEERLHFQRYSLVLQRLDGLWVNDGRAVESQGSWRRWRR